MMSDTNSAAESTIARLETALSKSEARCSRLEGQLTIAENELNRLNLLFDSFSAAWKNGKRSIKRRSFWW